MISNAALTRLVGSFIELDSDIADPTALVVYSVIAAADSLPYFQKDVNSIGCKVADCCNRKVPLLSPIFHC